MVIRYRRQRQWNKKSFDKSFGVGFFCCRRCCCDDGVVSWAQNSTPRFCPLPDQLFGNSFKRFLVFNLNGTTYSSDKTLNLRCAITWTIMKMHRPFCLVSTSIELVADGRRSSPSTFATNKNEMTLAPKTNTMPAFAPILVRSLIRCTRNERKKENWCKSFETQQLNTITKLWNLP